MLESWLAAVSGILWGPYGLIPLLVGTGIFLTLGLRGLQFRALLPALWLALVKRREPGGVGEISHFQALMTALAATVGTGNIAGVATALAAGGPGALFWMWVTGLIGMATKYAEALLSVRYRERDARGEMSGGPMYFLSRGLRWRGLGRGLGLAFALFAAIAAFGIGNGVQSEEVGNALQASFGFAPRGTQTVMALLVAAVTIGGIRWIGRVSSLLVPIMVLFYMGAGLVILWQNAAWIPEALGSVLVGAFRPSAFGGGLLGASVASALRFGIARGVFSNESGLGSAGIAAAAAATREPVRQALVSMTQTFIDTLVVCSVTGLVILTSVIRDAERVGDIEPAGLERSLVEMSERSGLDPFSEGFPTQLADVVDEGERVAPLARWRLVRGAEWTTLAFRESLPGRYGGVIVSLGLALFAFSTILGWSYYGEKSIEYLLGARVVRPYRLLFAAMVVGGPMLFSGSIWLLSDVTNALMAVPNLIGLLLLWPVVRAETRAYFSRGSP
ncbi:MAG: alanine/glycine:cation symporter family protein [Myxococcota bacterium]